MVYGNETCNTCGAPADADWTICSSCKLEQMQEATGEKGFIDEYGIFWENEEYERVMQEANNVQA